MKIIASMKDEFGNIDVLYDVPELYTPDPFGR